MISFWILPWRFFADEWGQVHFIGYSLFETDKRGVYKENLLAADQGY